MMDTEGVQESITREDIYFGLCFETGAEIPEKEDSQTNVVLVPKIEIKRERCPFFGFWNSMLGIIIDREDDQCGLLNIYNPCHMKKKGDTPCWKTCSFNTKSLSEIAKTLEKQNIKICPREFEYVGWKGLTISEWFNYFEKNIE